MAEIKLSSMKGPLESNPPLTCFPRCELKNTIPLSMLPAHLSGSPWASVRTMIVNISLWHLLSGCLPDIPRFTHSCNISRIPTEGRKGPIVQPWFPELQDWATSLTFTKTLPHTNLASLSTARVTVGEAALYLAKVWSGVYLHHSFSDSAWNVLSWINM